MNDTPSPTQRSDPDATPGTRESASSPRSRKEALTRLAGILLATTGLGLIIVWSWTLQPIRIDPFTSSVGWWESFVKPQPHPALARMPVLPMGAAGILSWRPASTGWLVGQAPAAGEAEPAAETSFLIG